MPLNLPAGIGIDDETAEGALELAALLMAGGADLGEAASQAAAVVDATLNFGLLVPGPVGALIEAVDGPIIRAIIMASAKAVRRRAEVIRTEKPASVRALEAQRRMVDAARGR